VATDEQKFFEKRKAAAFVKHEILAGYLKPYAMKVGVNAREVVFVDGYAGPGVYDSGEPGSPEVALQVSDAIADHRVLRGHFVEQKRTFADALRQHIDERSVTGWTVHQGSVKDRLPAVLADAGDSPLLMFLDPYGLAVPFDQLVNEVMSRTAKTEVVVNFSLAALKRLSGFLDTDYDALTEPGPEPLFGDRAKPRMTPERAEVAAKKRDGVIASLDAFLGGESWKEAKRSGRPGWRSEVRREWVERLCRESAPGWKHWSVAVPEKVDDEPVYDLVLFTRHRHGLWLFNDSASRAYFKLHQRSWGETASVETATLFDDPPLEKSLEKLQAEFVDRVAARIRNAVAAGQSFVTSERMDLLFDEALAGKAGDKHVRAALRQLHKGGIVGDPTPVGVKRIENYRITPGPAAPKG
jgi:hypothetical protein